MAKIDNAAAAQHEATVITAMGDNSAYNRHPDAQWFGRAGMGLFIHYGLSSVSGECDLSWGMIRNTTWDWKYMNNNKLKPSAYFRLADQFNPGAYDPEKWIAAAAQAGIRYAVLTTRHCEGYALWPSQYGEFSTRTHMGGRDLLRPYVDACRRHGLRVGFYYSPPDWYFNRDYTNFGFREPLIRQDMNIAALWMASWCGKPVNPGIFPDAPPYLDMDWEIAEEKAMPQEHLLKYADYVRGQILELLGEYGPIDLLWFDGALGRGVEAPISIAEIRRIQPGIVVNTRLHGTGDFVTPECYVPDQKPQGWWEGCQVWNRGGWGYTRNEAYNSTNWYLDLLARHRAWGGNLLVNCAPRPDGAMPDIYYARMHELRNWMDKNGEAIRDCEPGPWPERSSVPVTIRGDRWYLHLKPDEINAAILDQRVPKSAKLLATGEAVPFHAGPEGSVFFALLQHQAIGEQQVIAVEW